MRRILIAGAAGALGRHVTAEALRRGHRVRALTRRSSLPQAADDPMEVVTADALDLRQLAGICDGVDAVFSCLGASVLPDLRRGRRSFDRLDTPANLNLLAEAERAGCARFVYVSVAGDDRFGHLRYMSAHEAVVEAARRSRLGTVIIRPTGFFSAFGEILTMARKGTVPVIGDGSARSNPIDERDLAVLCVEAIEDGLGEIVAGGPEVMTRGEIVDLAYATLGRPPKVRYLSARLVRAMVPLMRPVNPRVADLTAFYVAVGTTDLIVPVRGERTLANYFRETVNSGA